MEAALEARYERLGKLLGDMGSVLLAFSGGVDSTLLLAVARQALGDNVIAATVHSPLHPEYILEGASETARTLGAEHITLDMDEPESENFASNPPQRCYFCKHDRFGRLIELAAREGMAEVVDGAQLEDTSDYRPGMEAARELGVRSPLLEAGFIKEEIRALSRELGLSGWDKPPGTCLATRVPYFQRITHKKLKVIEEAEGYLSRLGFCPVRVRLVDDRTARIEVNPPSLQALVSEDLRERVTGKMRQLGFTYTTLDLAGYRPGSMNEGLEDR